VVASNTNQTAATATPFVATTEGAVGSTGLGYDTGLEGGAAGIWARNVCALALYVLCE